MKTNANTQNQHKHIKHNTIHKTEIQINKTKCVVVVCLKYLLAERYVEMIFYMSMSAVIFRGELVLLFGPIILVLLLLRKIPFWRSLFFGLFSCLFCLGKLLWFNGLFLFFFACVCLLIALYFFVFFVFFVFMFTILIDFILLISIKLKFLFIKHTFV